MKSSASEPDKKEVNYGRTFPRVAGWRVAGDGWRVAGDRRRVVG